MDTLEVFIFDAGWIFLAAWGMALAALSVIAFGRDIRSATEQTKVAPPSLRQAQGRLRRLS
jgi:hypothetical protein